MKIKISKMTLFLMMSLLSLNTISGQNKLKGNKNVVNEDRGVSDFNAIEIKDKIEVVLVQGNDQSVAVETDENLQEAIITEVKNNTLVIRISKRIIKKKVLAVYITIDESIEEITTKSRASITADGPFNFDNITINAEGDSKITMDIKSKKFILNNKESANVEMTVNTENSTINANNRGRTKINLTANTAELLTQGSSTTELIGECEDMLITAENKSNVKASKLECNTIIANASDAADVHINAKESLTVSAINTSEVYIFNNPKITIETFSDKAILRKK